MHARSTHGCRPSVLMLPVQCAYVQGTKPGNESLATAASSGGPAGQEPTCLGDWRIGDTKTFLALPPSPRTLQGTEH